MTYWRLYEGGWLTFGQSIGLHECTEIQLIYYPRDYKEIKMRVLSGKCNRKRD